MCYQLLRKESTFLPPNTLLDVFRTNSRNILGRNPAMVIPLLANQDLTPMLIQLFTVQLNHCNLFQGKSPRTGAQLRGFLNVWARTLFNKRTKVPFLQCTLYFKKGVSLGLKRRGFKNILGASLPAPNLPSLP